MLVALLRVCDTFLVFEFAVWKWKHARGRSGIALMDVGRNLLDFRFADDGRIFAPRYLYQSRHLCPKRAAAPWHTGTKSKMSKKCPFPWEIEAIDHSFMIYLEKASSLLYPEETMVPTNDSQPPSILATDGGLKLRILQRNVGQKWWVACRQHRFGISFAANIELFTQTLQNIWMG